MYSILVIETYENMNLVMDNDDKLLSIGLVWYVE
jgi:hypothetical protein